VGLGRPSAEAAAGIAAAWLPAADARPALVVAEERAHAALVEHLRPRVLRMPAVPADPLAVAASLRAALDEGAALIAGGVAGAEGGCQPALLVNVPLGSLVLREPGVQGPFLCVARTRSLAAAEDRLEALGALERHVLAGSPQ